MKVLALDPGAKRCGWAIIEGNGVDPPIYHDSGQHGLTRGPEAYQEHKMDIIRCWADMAQRLLVLHDPDAVVSEIVPIRGANNMSQMSLAAAAVTAAQSVAHLNRYPLHQLSATVVKQKIGGAQIATKVAVRNGVQTLIPELADRKWTKEFDEPDAIAIALTFLGYDIKSA